jgi:hypothetical protein
MKRSVACFLLLFAIMCCVVCTSHADSMFVDGKEVPIDPNKPVLYQYINAPDSNFSWQDSAEYPPYNKTDKKLTVYEVNYTSQRWLTDADVDRSLWRHNFTIIVPWEIKLRDIGMFHFSPVRIYHPLASRKEVKSVLSYVPPILMLFNRRPLFHHDFLLSSLQHSFHFSPVLFDSSPHHDMVLIIILYRYGLCYWLHSR